jgi:hypothetical protein
MNIEINVEKFMSKFKKVKTSTLFEPSKEDITRALLQKKCPLCSRRLYQSRDGKMWRCKSVVKDGFIIRDEVLKNYW